jgi:hypothetical protein
VGCGSWNLKQKHHAWGQGGCDDVVLRDFASVTQWFPLHTSMMVSTSLMLWFC